MGLFDVFSKGGKYFGKSIEPRCEYCESGKRAKDGDKVLCSRKGLVNAGDHCPKFVYSPLKRIPVKQMKMVGFLEGDYDEKNDDEDENAGNQQDKKQSKKAEPAAAPAAEAAQEAPAVEKKPVISDDLAALAAAADAAEDYVPEVASAASEAADDLAALAAAADAEDSSADASALSAM